MANLPLRTFDQIVADQTATLASSLSVNSATFDSLNLTPGSPLLAILEANGGLVLFLQYLNWNVLRATRMQTSQGIDLDTFGADFLFARYPAVPSTGQAIFTRATANNQIYIPTNTLLRTLDGQQSFTVIAPSVDTLNIYDPVNGYGMAPNVYSISCLVQAVTAGSAGNIGAHFVQLQSSLPITSVDNPNSFINGQDSESDAQFISRFQLYINSLSRGTLSAIEYAIINTNPSYTYTILQNFIAVGQPQPGCILINFDNGTGLGLNPIGAQTLIAELADNVNDVIAAGITLFVQAAASCTVQLSVDILYQSTASYLLNASYTQNAITNYINSLAVGQTLYMTRLSQVIYDSSPAVLNAFNINLQALDQNGNFLTKTNFGDIPVNQGQVLRYIPNPPVVSGAATAVPSSVTIDPSFVESIPH